MAAQPLPSTNAGATSGTPTAPTVASRPAVATAGTVSPGNVGPPPATPPKPLFGGNVGRKTRADGLKPGSPEALAADRAKEAARKRNERAAKAAATPPPVLPAAGGPVPAVPSPAPGAAPAPGDLASGDIPGLVPGEAPPVPWQADSLRPLFDQLIEAAEASRAGIFLAKCAEAGLTAKLVKEIEADAHFPKTAKMLLMRSLPRLAAKWLNKTGLSAEYEDEVAVVSAVLLIVQNDRKLSVRLDKFIAEIAAAKNPKPEAARV